MVRFTISHIVLILRNSLGFKDLSPYLEAFYADQGRLTIPTPGNIPPGLHQLYHQCVERVQISNRQYARRQITWIRNKFVPWCLLQPPDAPLCHVYLVDSTDPSMWQETAVNPALKALESFLAKDQRWNPDDLYSGAKQMLDELVNQYTSVNLANTLESEQRALDVIFNNKQHKRCDDCGAWIREQQWNEHVRSRSHRRRVKRLQYKKSVSFKNEFENDNKS